MFPFRSLTAINVGLGEVSGNNYALSTHYSVYSSYGTSYDSNE